MLRGDVKKKIENFNYYKLKIGKECDKTTKKTKQNKTKKGNIIMAPLRKVFYLKLVPGIRET